MKTARSRKMDDCSSRTVHCIILDFLDDFSRLFLPASLFNYAATMHYQSQPTASGQHFLLLKMRDSLGRDAMILCIYLRNAISPIVLIRSC